MVKIVIFHDGIGQDERSALLFVLCVRRKAALILVSEAKTAYSVPGDDPAPQWFR